MADIDQRTGLAGQRFFHVPVKRGRLLSRCLQQPFVGSEPIGRAVALGAESTSGLRQRNSEGFARRLERTLAAPKGKLYRIRKSREPRGGNIGRALQRRQRVDAPY